MGVNGSKTKRTQNGSPAPIKKARWPMGVNGSTNKQNKKQTKTKLYLRFASPTSQLMFRFAHPTRQVSGKNRIAELSVFISLFWMDLSLRIARGWYVCQKIKNDPHEKIKTNLYAKSKKWSVCETQKLTWIKTKSKHLLYKSKKRPVCQNEQVTFM